MEFVIREDGILLKFEYNRELVRQIKRLQGRFFDSEAGGWVIPYCSVEELKNFIDIPKDIQNKLDKKRQEQEDILNSLNLKLPLKPFQKEAVKFMIERNKTMLCADMGLGKTCMSIAYAKYLLNSKSIEKAIIICPKTVRGHWKNEIDKFIDADSTIIEHRGKKKQKSWVDSLYYEFIIMNYEQLFNDNNFDIVKELCSNKTLVILDEVTRIKNIKAKTSKRVKALKSEYKVVLTGRPLENRPEELFSINGFLDNDIFGTWDFFKGRYIIYDNFGRVLSYHNLDDLGMRIKKVMFRRKKGEVLDDLPERIDNVYNIKLSTTESEDYTGISKAVIDALNEYEKGKASIKSVLSIIQMSKMFCDHPDLVRKSESRTARNIDITTNNHTKIDELINIIAEIDDKILIFSQYAEMCKIIESELKKNGYNVVLVTGKDKDKEKKIEEFKNKAQIMVSTDVMSYGVNLQFASYIVNYDLSWNPAVNEQRIARLHRMGQKNVVNVINLLVEDEDKIEKRITEVLGQKQEIFDEIFEK